MTANLKWAELINMLLQSINTMEDSMLLATVFNLKQKVLLQNLKENFSPYCGIF